MVNEEQLPHLLKLLDDEEPAIQSALQHEFADTNGDLSHEIAALAIDLPVRDRMRLSNLLLPGRRETLEHEWVVPDGGANAIAEDWETFESLLRIVSEYLHDGVTLRPSLPDMVDMLAMEAADEIESMSPNQLRVWMFESGRFIGNRENYYIPQNNDLCWVADTGFGSPISLATLFILVAHRLDLEVTGCNYPGHFLARIHIDSRPVLVDCFHRGRLIPVQELLQNNKNISQTAKVAILTECHLGHILSRILRNLEHSFRKDKHLSEAQLFRKLHDSLQ